MIFQGDRQDDIARLLGNVDAFDRFRVSMPSTVFGGTFSNNISALIWNTLTATGGLVTHVPAESSAQLSVTASSGSRAVLQTRRFYHYDPAKSRLIMWTTVFGTGQTNTYKQSGVFDDSDGVFFRQNGADVSVVIRSSTTGVVVDTSVAQSSWNLDKLDGTGSSGATVDFSKGNIYVVDLAWLGYGMVRFGVVVGSRVIYCHQFDHAGVLTRPYMQTATLPVRAEILNIAGVAGTSNFKVTCFAIMSEGGTHRQLLPGSANRGANGVTVSANQTRVPLISIRLKSSFLRASVEYVSYSIAHTDASDYLIEVLTGHTLTGSTFLVNASESVEADFEATSVTGGTILQSSYISTAAGGSFQVSSLPNHFQLSRSISGVADILSIVISTQSGDAVTDMRAALNWLESV